jgi:hypothetical protein
VSNRFQVVILLFVDDSRFYIPLACGSIQIVSIPMFNERLTFAIYLHSQLDGIVRRNVEIIRVKKNLPRHGQTIGAWM